MDLTTYALAKAYTDSQSGGTAPKWGNITGTLSDQSDLSTALGNKQDTLASGTNIKTINNQSILGSGNISISGGNNIYYFYPDEVTYAEVYAAYAAGKLPIAKYEYRFYEMTYFDSDTNEFTFTCFKDDTSYEMYMSADDGWVDRGSHFMQKELTAGNNITITTSGNQQVISAAATTYTAGNNVTISGNVISATDTTYTAGNNVTIVSGVISATGGLPTIKAGTGTNAEVFNGGAASLASGEKSHAEGYLTSASGKYAHAEGYYCRASGEGAHAEGCGGYEGASGNYSHTEGYCCIASEYAAHAEGHATEATESCAHAEGYECIASGDNSHAEGKCTKAVEENQHVQGVCNVVDNAGIYADIVGAGDPFYRYDEETEEWEELPKNISALGWDGNLHLKGNVYVGCNDDSTGGTMLTSGGSGNEIYWCTYQSTTFADITTAISNGKLPCINQGSTVAVLSKYNTTAAEAANKKYIFASSDVDSSRIMTFTVNGNNTWSLGQLKIKSVPNSSTLDAGKFLVVNASGAAEWTTVQAAAGGSY